MTLIPCPDCHREVSDRAVACPHCGHPISEETGKRSALDRHAEGLIDSLTEEDQRILRALQGCRLTEKPVSSKDAKIRATLRQCQLTDTPTPPGCGSAPREPPRFLPCPFCQTVFSSEANSCPHCGFPRREDQTPTKKEKVQNEQNQEPTVQGTQLQGWKSVLCYFCWIPIMYALGSNSVILTETASGRAVLSQIRLRGIGELLWALIAFLIIIIIKQSAPRGDGQPSIGKGYYIFGGALVIALVLSTLAAV